MSRPRAHHVIFGRDPDCHIVLDHPSVSGRHARLSWTREGLFLEDLGSTNGTFASGEKVLRGIVRRGDDILLGDVALPWGEPRLQPFLRLGEKRNTMMGRAIGAISRRKPARAATIGLGIAAALLGAGIVGLFVFGPGRELIFRDGQPRPKSDEEAFIRKKRAPAIKAAIDSSNGVTRNAAAKLAATDDGPYHVEQVALIWSHVRGRWKYVNDPKGGEYFAKASETITNEFVGDCDDYAITLAAMITAIGGEARVILMDGPGGGHAYTEVCLRQDPKEVATRLARHYKKNWDRYVGKQRLTEIHYRQSDACPVWLNLDWNAMVPGGQYVEEIWAVAVTTDGRTETLTPAGKAAVGERGATSQVRAAALPPVQ